MKRTTIHISAALALLLGLAACSRDDAGFLPEGAEGSPMVFTATGLNPAATASPTDAAADAATRAPVDGNWEGVTSVAVMIGGKVKAYDVTPTTADNTSATLTSDDPHYWTDRNDLRVTAWWPYNGEENLPAVKVRADQSTRDGYEGSDFIAAEEQAVSYANPTLRFTHRTARVTVALTDYTEESMNVRLTGLSTGNGNPAVITPYNKGGDTWSALVAPQTVAAGTAFITCTFTSGKSFVYKMKNDAEWKAGEEYTYTVSLAAADPGYTYDEATHTYIVYNANGLLAWGEAARKDLSLNCTLTADITLPEVAEKESNWTPVGYYYTDDNCDGYIGTFDGGSHTITGLTIYLPDQDYAGLFGYIGDGGKVQNVTLTEVNVTGGTYTGGVAGYIFGVSIVNCSVLGSVSGSGSSSCVGGVAGYSFSVNIVNCSVSGSVSVSGSESSVGGVVGYSWEGTLTDCSVSGNVKGNSNVGGVAGCSIYSPLTDCSVSGDVTGTGDYVGGVEGEHQGMTSHVETDIVTGNDLIIIDDTCPVTGCSFSGNVSGNNYVGGVVGNESIVIACYATGNVSGNSYVGGVMGVNGSMTACYHAAGEVTGTGNFVGGVVGENQSGILTTCYWSNNLDTGIGYNRASTDGTAKVDGTAVTWVDAVAAMNTALQNAGSSWQYELPDENSLPVLKKGQ